MAVPGTRRQEPHVTAVIGAVQAATEGANVGGGSAEGGGCAACGFFE
jgi:hypothetical protein